MLFHCPRHRAALGGAALLVFLASGCDYIPERPQLSERTDERDVERSVEGDRPAEREGAPAEGGAAETGSPEASDRAPLEPPSAVADQNRETWDAYRIGDSPAGFRHLRIEPAGVGDGDYLRYTSREQITIRRGGTRLTQSIEHTSLETDAGRLVRFTGRIEDGQSVTETEGVVDFDQLVIVSRREGQEVRRTLPWRADDRGFFAVEQSLRAAPMQPGERRRMRVLLPTQYTQGEVELHATGYARVPLLDGSTPRLLEIEQTVRVGGTPLMRSTLWTDEQGDALKTYVAAMDMTTERTDRATATRGIDEPVDLLASTRINLDRPIDPGSDATTYRVAHRSEDPRDLIADSGRQRVRSVGPRSVEVEVVRPAEGEPPVDADRRSGPLIQSNDAGIQRIARQLDTDSEDPWQAAVRLRDFVHRYVNEKNFSRGFSTAAEVARDATGDCTEHSVLLAALCRAKGIPAKVAAGLVYLPEPDGPHMAYHMWTLVWDGSAWQPLDATFGNRPTGTDRIELVVSNLSDGNEYECLAPVIQVIGQLEIDVVDD